MKQNVTRRPLQRGRARAGVRGFVFGSPAVRLQRDGDRSLDSAPPLHKMEERGLLDLTRAHQAREALSALERVWRARIHPKPWPGSCWQSTAQNEAFSTWNLLRPKEGSASRRRTRTVDPSFRSLPSQGASTAGSRI